MDNLVELVIASDNDAEEIIKMMIEIEQDETNKWYKNGERPFIPGFDCVEMHKYHMWDNKYYKIMFNKSLAGIILLYTTGREHARIDRFYIHPTYQNKGIGSKVIELIEKKYPMVKVWTLDTIQKSKRNHYFYERNGFILIGEDNEERYYSKVIGNTSIDNCINKDLINNNIRNNNMNNLDIYNSSLYNARLSNVNMSSTIYQNANISKSRFTNVNMSNSIIGDSNLNNIEICNVSLRSAYIHDTNLGYQDIKEPLKIERCELMNCEIINSNLQNIEIKNCNIEGMTIDGILVSELLKLYKNKNN